MATAPALGLSRDASEAPRLRVRPTASGVVGILLSFVILAAALNTGNNLLYLLTGLILGALPVSWWLSRRSLRALRAELLLPADVTAGEDGEAALRLHAEDRAVPGLRIDGSAVTSDVLPFLAAGGSAVRALRLRAAQRGRLRVELGFSTVFPWGLLRTSCDGPSGELLVLPRPLRGMRAPATLGLVPDGRPTRLPGQGQDLLEIRDYRAGDDARKMDWKATARRERPMVRQGAREEERRATVVIDPSPVGEGAEAQRLVEEAISRAAGALIELGQAGWQVRLVHPDGDSRGSEREQLRALARLEVPDTALSAGWWRSRVPPGEPVLVCRAEGGT